MPYPHIVEDESKQFVQATLRYRFSIFFQILRTKLHGLQGSTPGSEVKPSLDPFLTQKYPEGKIEKSAPSGGIVFSGRLDWGDGIPPKSQIRLLEELFTLLGFRSEN